VSLLLDQNNKGKAKTGDYNKVSFFDWKWISMKIYFGLTKEEVKDKRVVYSKNLSYKYKAVNITLDGLKKFIHDNNLEDTIIYYTILDSSIFELANEVEKDKKYNMIAVKIPFSFRVNNYHKL